MKYKIQYSPEALNDLDEIWEYIQMELGNVTAAENTINKMLDAIGALEVFQEQGTPLSSVAEVAYHYCLGFSGNYMAFYRVEEQTIFVDRILYHRHAYWRALFGNLSFQEE